jgi:hypothetical protein
MRIPARNLIVWLLCCLLPVQSALAFARSTSMISHHAGWLQTQSDQARQAHQEHQEHQEHQAHQAHSAETRSSADKAAIVVQAAAKPSSHSQASCTDCGKCCLMGAAAPPPAAMQAAAQSFVLRVFKPACPESAGHIPEQPERPPRLLATF